MKDERKNEMSRQFTQMVILLKRIRSVCENSGIKIELDDVPEEPKNVDQLAEVLNTVRSNMNRLECALNDWDRKVNGCETRTRKELEDDIEQDRKILSGPGNSPDGVRPRRDIELNVAYDQMQLGRL